MCDNLLACGFNRPPATLTLRDVPQLIECVTLHSTLLIVKAELDEILKGLKDAGVLEVLHQSPGLFKPLFVYQDKSLAAGTIALVVMFMWLFVKLILLLTGDIVDLFKVKNFSEQGSLSFTKEQATYMFFKDFLEELEGTYVCVCMWGWGKPMISGHIMFTLWYVWAF